MAETAEAVSVEVFDQGDAAPESPAAGKVPAPDTNDAAPTDDKPTKGKVKDAPKEEAAPKEGDAPVPWWQTVAGGKYKSEEDAVKGFGEVYGLANTSAKEAKEAAKKAADLEGKWKTVEPILGAPVDDKGEPAPYDFGFPPEADVDPVLLELASNVFRELNLSNGFAQKVAPVLANYEAQRELGRREYERGRCIETLGAGNEEVASAAATAAFQWAGKLLADDPAAIEDLKECGGVGAAINTLARLQRMTTGISMGRSMGAGAGLDKAGYEAIVSQNGWFNDSAKSAQVEEYLNRIAPGGEPKEQDS